MNSTELKAKRDGLVDEAESITKLWETEKRLATNEESQRWDTLMAEADSLKAQIDQAERKEYTELIKAELKTSVRQIKPSKPYDYRQRDNLVGQAMTAWFCQGLPGVRMTSEMQDAAHDCGIDLGARYIRLVGQRAAMGVGDANLGQEFVAPAFYNVLTEALKSYGGMLQVSDVINRSTGVELPFPVSDDSASVGEIVSEHSDRTDDDIATDEVRIPTFLYSSKAITVSYQLLQDSAFNLPEYIAKALGTRIGRILNSHLTDGTGTTMPRGAVTDAYSVTPAGGLDYDFLVDVQDSLEQAYQANATWMVSRANFGLIRKMVDGNERPLIWDGGMNLSAGQNYTLLGQPVVINNDLDDILLYGDFKNFKVLQVQDVIVQRFDDYVFAKKHHVGFAAWARYGGGLVDAGTHPIVKATVTPGS